jgi:hypothetical protein
LRGLRLFYGLTVGQHTYFHRAATHCVHGTHDALFIPGCVLLLIVPDLFKCCRKLMVYAAQLRHAFAANRWRRELNTAVGSLSTANIKMMF